MKYKLAGPRYYYGYWDHHKDNPKIYLGDGSNPRATPYLFNSKAEAEFVLNGMLDSVSGSLNVVEIP
jgi:hypothetical protein